MMLCSVIVGRKMALSTHGVALGDKLIAVGIVAIGANHARLVHFALDKRAVNVDLVTDLPVWPVQWFLDQGQPVGVQQRLARVVFTEGAPSGMTTPAGIDLL